MSTATTGALAACRQHVQQGIDHLAPFGGARRPSFPAGGNKASLNPHSSSAASLA
jgi:hypothetical protein